jgi:predicted dehydrogenase
MNTFSGDTRVAILGCGAVTELAYLPALSRVKNVRIALLVDTNAERCERLAAKFNVEHTATDIDGHYDLIDAAIVELPHSLHAPASIKLLAQGKSVLVEKPMATTAADCDAMISVADRTGAKLGVGLFRRYIWSLQFARTLVQEGALGRIQSFDFRSPRVWWRLRRSWSILSFVMEYASPVGCGGVSSLRSPSWRAVRGDAADVHETTSAILEKSLSKSACPIRIRPPLVSVRIKE